MAQADLAYPVAWIWGSGFLFALVHSVLASRPCKLGYYALGLSPRAYRLGYSVIALFTTALWLSFVHLLPDTPVYAPDGIGRWLLHGVQLAGVWGVWLSLKPVDVPAFLGFRAFPGNSEPFIEEGIYRRMRHPMYTGIMLILLAHPEQSLNSLNLYLCISVYFIIGSKFEERRMCADHPEYADYMARTPAFIPRLTTG